MSSSLRHAPPAGKRGRNQELLYDPNIPTPTHAERARTLVEGEATATLCTLSSEHEGYPYGSFVTFAMLGPDPIFLISALAEHTKNLETSSRTSLLVSEAGEGNPLALGRVTIVGDCTRLPEEEREVAKSVFLAKHPSSEFYIDFEDFSFWRLEAASIRYIGGFGRMSWVDKSDWSLAECDPIAPIAQGIMEHMNEDHTDAMVLYCKMFTKASDTTEATMVGVDRYGFEMSAQTEEGPRPIRLAFSSAVTSSEDIRREMVQMAQKARELSSN